MKRPAVEKIVLPGNMYNIMHGEDPNASLYLNWLDLNCREDLPRYRDIHLNSDGSLLFMLTRSGGSNREDYRLIHAILARHDCYLGDADDSYDSTYAVFTFRVPPIFADQAKALATGVEPPTLKELTRRAAKEIGMMTPEQLRAHPRYSQLADVIEEINEKLLK